MNAKDIILNYRVFNTRCIRIQPEVFVNTKSFKYGASSTVRFNQSKIGSLMASASMRKMRTREGMQYFEGFDVFRITKSNIRSQSVGIYSRFYSERSRSILSFDNSCTRFDAFRISESTQLSLQRKPTHLSYDNNRYFAEEIDGFRISLVKHEDIMFHGDKSKSYHCNRWYTGFVSGRLRDQSIYVIHKKVISNSNIFRICRKIIKNGLSHCDASESRRLFKHSFHLIKSTPSWTEKKLK